jgi:hypothetical protein
MHLRGSPRANLWVATINDHDIFVTAILGIEFARCLADLSAETVENGQLNCEAPFARQANRQFDIQRRICQNLNLFRYAMS